MFAKTKCIFTLPSCDLSWHNVGYCLYPFLLPGRRELVQHRCRLASSGAANCSSRDGPAERRGDRAASVDLGVSAVGVGMGSTEIASQNGAVGLEEAARSRGSGQERVMRHILKCRQLCHESKSRHAGDDHHIWPSAGFSLSISHVHIVGESVAGHDWGSGVAALIQIHWRQSSVVGL